MTGAFSIFVLSRRLGEVIGSVARDDVQRIPVNVEGADGDWEILNPLKLVDCLDYQKSVIKPFYPDNYPDPARARKPRGIIRLIIDPARVGKHHVFRIKDWMGPVIVSQELRDAVEESATIGVRFFPVTE